MIDSPPRGVFQSDRIIAPAPWQQGNRCPRSTASLGTREILRPHAVDPRPPASVKSDEIPVFLQTNHRIVASPVSRMSGPTLHGGTVTGAERD